jgi:hypothetical protein
MASNGRTCYNLNEFAVEDNEVEISRPIGKKKKEKMALDKGSGSKPAKPEDVYAERMIK